MPIKLILVLNWGICYQRTIPFVSEKTRTSGYLENSSEGSFLEEPCHHYLEFKDLYINDIILSLETSWISTFLQISDEFLINSNWEEPKIMFRARAVIPVPSRAGRG